MKKRILAIAFSLTLVIGVCGFCTVAQKEPVTVEIDGMQVDFDVEPQIVDGRTLVPMRKIFEELGALVKWDEETQTVYAKKNKKEVSLKINSNELIIDKGDTDEDGNPVTQTVTLDVASVIKDGRTLVPTRAVAEAFGLQVDWDKNERTVTIESDNEEDNSWKENVVTINLSDMSIEGDGAQKDGNGILITKGGDYTVSGTLKSGNITVNTKEKVKIRLNNASITSENEPCIYFEKVKKGYITIENGTENTLTAKIEEKGAIYAKDDLEIKGKGTLFVNSDYHGIKASDNLTIENGSIEINAKKDGINVNDTFKMTGGSLDITAENDGISSDSIVIIEGGKINVETTLEPTKNESSEESQNNFGRQPFENNESYEFSESAKGIKADWMMSISGGEITVNSTDHAIHCADETEIKGGTFTLSSEYKKGISAHGNFTIDGEDTKIDILKSTEGLESKNILTINNGNITINASDDGINATGGNSGEMFGGPGGGGGFNPGNNGGQNDFKPQKPEDNGQNAPQNGQQPPLMPDNGNQPGENGGMPPEFNENEIPQNGGNRPHGMGGFGRGDRGEMPENGSFSEDKTNENMQRPENVQRPDNDFNKNDKNSRYKDCLVINGGYIEIYAEDDCLDSNGNLIVNGGTIKASLKSGSFAGNFGVFDPDGTLTVSENATLVLATPQGEERNLNLSQNSIVVYCDSQHKNGEKITVTDESGKVVFEYEPKADFKAVLIASPTLELKENYVVKIGDEAHEVTLSEKSVTVGTKQNQNQGGHGRK